METSKKNDLCQAPMEGRWREVFDLLKEDRGLFTGKITALEDTVLHMAMYAPEETQHEVADMVDLVLADDQESSEKTNVLGATNLKGNTPLHLAASTGNVEMCQKISGADRSFIVIRNKDGETLLFVAALYGRRNAFLSLHYWLYGESPRVSSMDYCTPCVRNNKDTILHCAIAQEYSDVAIEILYLYEDLVDPTV